MAETKENSRKIDTDDFDPVREIRRLRQELAHRLRTVHLELDDLPVNSDTQKVVDSDEPKPNEEKPASETEKVENSIDTPMTPARTPEEFADRLDRTRLLLKQLQHPDKIGCNVDYNRVDCTAEGADRDTRHDRGNGVEFQTEIFKFKEQIKKEILFELEERLPKLLRKELFVGNHLPTIDDSNADSLDFGKVEIHNSKPTKRFDFDTVSDTVEPGHDSSIIRQEVFKNTAADTADVAVSVESSAISNHKSGAESEFQGKNLLRKDTVYGGILKFLNSILTLSGFVGLLFGTLFIIRGEAMDNEIGFPLLMAGTGLIVIGFTGRLLHLSNTSTEGGKLTSCS